MSGTSTGGDRVKTRLGAGAADRLLGFGLSECSGDLL